LSDLTVRLGNKLREIRKAKRMTQEGLADDAGLSRNYVNEVERGRRNVTLAAVQSLAQALGVKMAELMPD
jgi:transcriptional regulator with XRE-family HTH domain